MPTPKKINRPLSKGWNCHSVTDFSKPGVMTVKRYHLSHTSKPHEVHDIPVFTDGYPVPFASAPGTIPLETAKELLTSLGHKLDNRPHKVLGDVYLVYLKPSKKE